MGRWALATFACLVAFLDAALPGERPVRVGVYENKPLAFLTEGGRPQGICIEILEEIARREGWRLEYVAGSWPECLERLERGKIDLLVAIAYAEGRLARFDFTHETVLSNWGIIYTRPGAPTRSFLDLQGKVVAGVPGDIYYESLKRLLAQFGVKCRFLDGPEYLDAVRAVEEGNADAAVTNRLIGRVLERDHEVARTPILFKPIELRFGLPKGKNADLAAAIDRDLRDMKAKRGSAYYQALDHWLGGVARPGFPRWVWWALGGTLGLLVTSVALGALLGKMVRRRTEALHLANQELRERLREVEEARAQLQAAEKEKALILASVGELVIYHAPDMRILWANRAAGQSLGMPAEELVGNFCFRLWRQRQSVCPDCPVAEAMRTGRPCHGEVQSPDGRTWFISGYPVANDQGEVLGAVEITRDITAQRRAEEAARASEEKFRKAFESCPDPMMITVLETGQVLDVSRSFEDFSGYARGEAVGKTTLELGLWVEPRERNRFVEAVAREGRVRNLEARFRMRNGREEIGLVSSEQILIGGRPCILSTVKMITQRRQAERALRESEAKFRTLIETIPHSVTIFQDDRNVYINPAGLRMFGCTDPDQIVGHDVMERVADCDKERLAGYIRARAGGGRVPDHYFATLKRLDGEEFPAEVYVRPTIFNGRSAWQVMAMDITERVRAEEELRRYRQGLENLVEQRTAELAEVNAELEAFAYSVSHDLRAPLRAMEGFAEALLEDYSDKLNSEGQDYARAIAQAAKKMDTLVCDLLAYSRIGRQEIHLDRVDLEAVVEEVLANLNAEINDRGATVEVQEHLPTVQAHYATLAQVVANLVSNALKFVEPPKTPIVRIWAEEDGLRVRLWVEDNGIGIAPEHHERIFHVFERLHGADKYPGTGIGLAIVRRGAERMGGKVGLESKPGHGSRFFVELPRPTKVT